MIVSNRYSCLECASKCDIFRLLTDFELELVEKNRYEVRFKAGEVIIKQGSAMTHVVAFLDGLAKIYLEGYNNKDLILKLQKPKEVIAGPGLYSDLRNHFSFTALQPSVVCMIEVNVFKQILRQNPAFMEAFNAEESSRILSVYGNILSLTQKQMHGRIADALIYLSGEVFGHDHFDMILSRQELADMTAMTKESATRILQQFKNEGLINVSGNYFEILNKQQLKNISHTG